MATPRVFVSSTYYDLKYIRDTIEHFIQSLGYQPILFERGTVSFDPNLPLDESCYEEIDSCDIFVLILGGRYGSPASRSGSVRSKTSQKSQKEEDASKTIAAALSDYNSVTQKEYEKARLKRIPIYIFIEKGVYSEYFTYKNNRTNNPENIEWAHVDSINIFKLIDDIYSQSHNNLVKDFATADDITEYLKHQWAGVFVKLLSKHRTEAFEAVLKNQMDSLAAIVDTLKTYSEAIMKGSDVKNANAIIEQANKKIEQIRAANTIKDIPFVAHLTEWHDIRVEEVEKLICESTSYLDLIKRVHGIDPKRVCRNTARLILEDFDAINEARRELGLKLFEREPIPQDYLPKPRVRHVPQRRQKKSTQDGDNA